MNEQDINDRAAIDFAVAIRMELEDKGLPWPTFEKAVLIGWQEARRRLTGKDTE